MRPFYNLQPIHKASNAYYTMHRQFVRCEDRQNWLGFSRLLKLTHFGLTQQDSLLNGATQLVLKRSNGCMNHRSSCTTSGGKFLAEEGLCKVRLRREVQGLISPVPTHSKSSYPRFITINTMFHTFRPSSARVRRLALRRLEQQYGQVASPFIHVPCLM